MMMALATSGREAMLHTSPGVSGAAGCRAAGRALQAGQRPAAPCQRARLASSCPLHVALLASLLLVGAGGAAPRLPQEVNLWEYFSGTQFESHRPQDGRFWGREWLRQATATVDAERIERVLRKLNAGQPIMVMAFGSSITAEKGGMFEPRPGMLAALVPMPVHRHAYHGDGWLRMLMQQINTTWPHPDHLLYNLGQAGGTFLEQAGMSCLEAKLPHAAVDLVIAEFIPRVSVEEDEFADKSVEASTQDLERFMWRLYAHFAALHHPPPAHVFLKPMANSFNSDASKACPMADCPATCPATFPGPFAEPGRDAATEWRLEQRIHRVVKYYGQTSLSVRHLLLAAAADAAHVPVTSSATPAARAGAPTAANTSQYLSPYNYSAPQGHHATPDATVSECEMARLLYTDLVHPSVLGQMLYADLIVNLLADAESHLLGTHPILAPSPANTTTLRTDTLPNSAATPAAAHGSHTAASAADGTPGSSSPSNGSSSSDATAAAAAGSQLPRGETSTPPSAPRPDMPAVTLTREGRSVWQNRCYGDMPSRVLEQVLLGHAAQDASGNVMVRTTGMHPLVMPDGHAGWTHVSKQVDVLKPGDTPKHKPGWVGTVPGAQLRIQVDAIFPSHGAPTSAIPSSSSSSPSLAVSSFAIATIRYLRSYQHMGTARAACLPPCVCEPVDIDAYCHEPVSVAASMQLHISAPQAKCLLELTILNTTTSPDREHKFKLIQVVLSAPIASR